MAKNSHFLNYPDVNESRESRELLHFFDRSKTQKGRRFPDGL